jgi:hypothetical protein
MRHLKAKVSPKLTEKETMEQAAETERARADEFCERIAAAGNWDEAKAIWTEAHLLLKYWGQENWEKICLALGSHTSLSVADCYVCLAICFPKKRGKGRTL